MNFRKLFQKWILVQVQGGAALQPADILSYFEELRRGTNTEIGTKHFAETASYSGKISLGLVVSPVAAGKSLAT